MTCYTVQGGTAQVVFELCALQLQALGAVHGLRLLVIMLLRVHTKSLNISHPRVDFPLKSSPTQQTLSHAPGVSCKGVVFVTINIMLCLHCAAGMNACISVGKLTEARALLQDMKQQNIPADIRVFNILLKGYSRRGGVAAVAGIMQEMSDAGLKPSAVTYNTLIDTYVNAGQLPQARQMCSDALDAGQEPHDTHLVPTLLRNVSLTCNILAPAWLSLAV